MAIHSIAGGARNNNTGTILMPSTVTSDLVGSLPFSDNNSEKNNPNPTANNGVVPCFVGSGVVLTSVANNGSGYCRFTKSSHGRSVGDVIFVAGSTDGNLDRTHTITAVPTSGTFDTDVLYVASATAGTYTRLARTFNNPTTTTVMARGTGDNNIAGTDVTVLDGATDFGAAGSNPFRGSRRLDITAWDYATGTPTHGSAVGDNVTGHDPENDAAIDVEPQPTNDAPGELVFRDGSVLPQTVSYPARTT